MTRSLLIIDDHVLFREGLRALFETRSDFNVAGEASDGRAALELATSLKPDLVIMNATLPVLNADETIRRMSAAMAAPRVIVLSAFAVKGVVKSVFRAGAHGFVLKTSRFDELLVAAEQVLKGERYLSTGIEKDMVANYIDELSAGDPATILTPRELEVVKLLADGYGTKDVSRALSIGEKTVHTHRAQAMKKLKIDSVAELTKYAIREGLTSI